MTHSRFSCLDQLMASNYIDAIVLNPGSTLTYLTGLHFHLMERPTVLLYKLGSQPALILPELEAGKLASSTIPLTSFTFGDDPVEWQSVFNRAIDKLRLDQATLGVEPACLRYMEMTFLQNAAPDAKFSSADAVFGNLRLQKDKEEITCMREAVRIAQDALRATLPCIKEGVSEKEIASELIIQMYKAGSSPNLPFAPIVAGGPNSANPHAVPSDRKFERGDLVVIDWGAGCNDYCSDLTRTFAIGELSQELCSIYQTVQTANQAGRAMGKPGIKAGEVDIAARTVIDKAGFGEFFTHRTGHGLGMDSHEPPYIFGSNDLLLTEGMVYTVEPGIYLSGNGGVRIEDDIVVTLTDSESMSDFPRDLQILG
ncbi:MAG: putative M24B family peptidase [Chloroflexi bacterium]|nr:MAG: putative M24B family peptidase [Chloroflexota bacterium]MBA4376453.1 aminopeptidase P family protein [Anaerolinea sp.]